MIRENMDRAWEFSHGQPFGGIIYAALEEEKPGRLVHLPHDFMIEADPFPEAPGGTRSGYFGGGVGTYKKILNIPEDAAGKRVLIAFDGSYMNTTVALNGHQVKMHHYGYTPFHADLTPYMKPGKPNRLTVTVNNSAQPNERWYTGSGLYRHVDLLIAPKVHIAPWGIFARTSHIANGTAFVIVETTVENHTADLADVWVDLRMKKESSPEQAGAGRVKIHAIPGGKSTGKVMIAVEEAELWDLDSPHLYTITAELRNKEVVLDSDHTLFGIRRISVDTRNGFMLNGRTIKLKGGCVHHDNGILGAASFRDSEYRKMKIHKDNGYNAIRSSHYPPSRDMLEACDRLGLLVINEAFDVWTMAKSTHDYSLYFKEHWKADMEAFILRDRNHPSIIMWSTGNEITERGGLSEGSIWAVKLAAWVRELDPSRPVTNALCGFFNGLDDENMALCQKEMLQEFNRSGTIQNFESKHGKAIWGELTEAYCAVLDVVGYNYLAHRYGEDKESYPNRVICGTESKALEMAEYWEAVERYPHVIGDFTWTSYDYIGEAGIGRADYIDPEDTIDMLTLKNVKFPWRLSNDADFDLCGFPRAQHAYRKIVWGSSRTFIASRRPEHYGKKEILGKWGWPDCENSWSWAGAEGKPVRVDVYSAAEEVELILNGRSLGRKPAGKANRFTAKFELVYEPGTLEAVSFSAGKQVSSDLLKSAGEPAEIWINLESKELQADGQSLCYAVIEVMDEAGNLVPDAQLKATATVEGAATLAAFGTGRPQTSENYTTGQFTSYKGRLQAIVRAGYEPGESFLTVAIEGLETVTVQIPVK
jgi:Beta-galactosidase/beta-glucuronidase